MKRTKWIAFVLVLVMTLGLMPIAVSALDLKLPEKFETTNLGTRVNPLYENVLSPEDFDFPTHPAEPSGNAAPMATQYVTIQKAGQQMRDYMEARNESFSLYIQSTSSDYNQILEDVFALEHTGQPKEGDSLMWQYAAWSGSVDGTSDGENYQYCYTLDFAYYTTAAQEKELDSAVSSLLESLNVSGKSDYQKICAIYDYMCENITYDYDNLEDESYTLKFTPYAALKNKTAVCQGYALLFYRLMLELDVDARLIAGDGGGPHAWNIVKLGDVYYNVDSTWDAGYDEYAFFLKNTENFVDHARYLDYMTTQFHTDYPMSATDYVDGVAGEPEYFFVIGQCGENAYFGINRDRQLVIAGEGSTYDYALNNNIEKDGAIWNFWADAFNQVVVEEGITRLGDNSFYLMDNIQSMSLADSIQTIGMNAFYGCDGFKNISLPSGLEFIDYNAFYNCGSLVAVSLPENFREFGVGVFQYCYSLATVSLNENLQSLGSSTFSSCTSLTQIVIPDSVTEVGGFEWCTSLKQVTLGKNVETLSTSAFIGCQSLTDIQFPEGLRIIGPEAFEQCTALTEITFPSSIEQIFGFEGCTSLSKITFLGPAPMIDSDTFKGVTATAYYPGDLEGWTEDVLQDYGGDITWVSTHTHKYTSSVVAPTCTEKGYTTYTCSGCGNVYQDNYVDALGHDYGEPEYISKEEGHRYECTRCGTVKTELCTFDQITVLVEATTENLGIRQHSCSACDGSYETRFAYRFAGEGRVETGIEVADQLKTVLGIEEFNSIIIANGDNFADVLAGSYLAASKDAPILLHRNSGKGDDLNEAYIQENLTADGTVYLLGGTASIPASIEDSLIALGYQVVRLAGDTRFDTNMKILEEAGFSQNDEILITTAWEFADCLSASATGKPILMLNTIKGELTEAQKEFLNNHKSNDFTIIGGTAAVSEKLEADIEAIVGDVDRIFGAGREETSVAIANRYFDQPDTVLIAYSRNFPDGLCGGPLAYAMKAPLLLVNAKREAPAAEYVAVNEIANGFVLGGTVVVSDASVAIIFAN